MGFAVSFVLLLVTFGCDPNSQSKVIPATIDGASMAPFLLGDHLEATCEDCSFGFACEITDKNRNLVCPNCGFAEIAAKSTVAKATERVNLRANLRTPKRWDVVGFELADRDAYGVKRVVGLPEEEIEIINGDIWADGDLLRKPIDVQRKIRIPVFDSIHSAKPPFDLSGRFESMNEKSNWRFDEGEIQFMVLNDEQPPLGIDWLTYQHWRCFVHRDDRDKVFPIEDSYGYNQTTSRELIAVDDLFVDFEVEFENGPVDFHWRFRRENVVYTFSLLWDGARWNFLVANNLTDSGFAHPKPLTYLRRYVPADPTKLKIEFSSFDQRLIVVLNDSVCLEQFETDLPLPPTEEATAFEASDQSVLKFGAASSVESLESTLKIKRLRIWRDVYYLGHPVGHANETASMKSGPTGVVLLGDNSPRSLDSRTWESPGMDLKKLIGVVESRDTP